MEKEMIYSPGLVVESSKNLKLTENYFTPELLRNHLILKAIGMLNVKHGLILGKSRKREHVVVRVIIMKILKSEFDLTLEFIGNLLGGRHHSTVINGLKMFQYEYGVQKDITYFYDSMIVAAKSYLDRKDSHIPVSEISNQNNHI